MYAFCGNNSFYVVLLLFYLFFTPLIRNSTHVWETYCLLISFARTITHISSFDICHARFSHLLFYLFYYFSIMIISKTVWINFVHTCLYIPCNEKSKYLTLPSFSKGNMKQTGTKMEKLWREIKRNRSNLCLNKHWYSNGKLHLFSLLDAKSK